MSKFQTTFRDRPAVRPDMSVDAGLRAFMLGVYNKMGLGLVVSAGLAWATASVEPVRDILFVVADGRLTGYTPLGMGLAFAPLVVLLGSAFLVRSASPRMASLLYRRRAERSADQRQAQRAEACGRAHGDLVAAKLVVGQLQTLGVMGGQAREDQNADAADGQHQCRGLQEQVDQARDDETDHAHDQEGPDPAQVPPGRVSVEAERAEG